MTPWELKVFALGMTEMYTILSFQLAPLPVRCLQKLEIKCENYDVSTNLYTLLGEKKKNPEK